MPCAYQFVTIFNGCAIWLECYTDQRNGCFSSPPWSCICNVGCVSTYPTPIYVVPLACAQNSYAICCTTKDVVSNFIYGEASTIARNICGNFYGGYGGITNDGINYAGSMCYFTGFSTMNRNDFLKCII